VEYIIFRKYVKRFSIILMEVIMKKRLCQQKRRFISSAFFCKKLVELDGVEPTTP